MAYDIDDSRHSYGLFIPARASGRLPGGSSAGVRLPGLAGGRVARIVDAAGATPNSRYSYSGSKEGLFYAAVRRALGDLGAAVPVTRDPPGSADRSLDWLLANPDAIRLHM